MYSLDEIMESRNIAVIGASRDALKPGAMLLKVLQDTGFQGQVAGVNPQGGQIHGLPLYRSLKEIPFPLELAVLLISPEAVPQALAECARTGVKGVCYFLRRFRRDRPTGRAVSGRDPHHSSICWHAAICKKDEASLRI
jgi:acetyltransferase